MVEREIEQKRKRIDAIEIIRVFCVLSVIGAHFSGKVFSTFTGIPLFIFYCYRAYGTVGVVTFFILSGFLYNHKGKQLSDILGKKLKYILLPTYIAAVTSYTATHIGNFSIKELMTYCYGGGSLYYYITVLMLCYIIFYFIGSNMCLLCGAMVLNAISIFLFASDIITYDQLPYPYLTSYLIPTNWIGFFAVGVILREKNLWKKMMLWAEKRVVILAALFSISTIAYAYFCAGVEISYFVYQAIPYELLGTLTIMGFSKKLNRWSVLNNIGNASFFIYLYHINIIGFASNRFCFNWFVVLLYPVMIALILWGCSLIIKQIFYRMGIGEFLFVLGIKEL